MKQCQPPAYDAKSYKGRHLIVNAFKDAKQFRGIFTRFSKLAIMFEGQCHLVAWVVGTRETRRGRGLSPHHAA